MTEPRPLRVWAIVVGGGSGSRFGRPKQFEPIGSERVLDRSVRVARGACDGVVVVVPPEFAQRERAVGGGASRAASVARGLDRVPDDADVIVVHDAARPLATHDLYLRVIEAVAAGADGAVPGVPVPDTIKLVTRDGRVAETPDRAALVAVQTPQAFAAAALRAAHADPALATDPTVTDDASMVERRGGTVVVVAGDPLNRKITHPEDLDWARRRVLGAVDSPHAPDRPPRPVYGGGGE